MKELSYSEMIPVLDALAGMKKQLAPKPLYFYKYLAHVLSEDRKALEAAGQFQYPKVIKIPKANKYMLRGDYEPEYTITLDECPTMDDGNPIWCMSSEKQVYKRYGYKNLDARQISDEKLDMEFIHCFLGGSSGHGKSVTLNSLIGAMCHEYAPWDLELHLSDAKIVEFKKYGVGPRIPHIASIAATEDADFVISVLMRCVDEMKERQKIFGSLGVSNLAKFRQKTGLAYPRVVILMDEFESTCKMAGKQVRKIEEAVDSFTRLGRAAGYHLYLATQNLTSDIPSSALGQIRNRYCLGAMEPVSQAVLGNAAASHNIGRIGMLIANTEVLAGGDTSIHNVKYQTPLIEDEEFEGEKAFLESWGKKVGFRSKLAFYDEEDVKTIDEFTPIVDKAIARMRAEQEINPQNMPLCLGYPAFVTTDKDELLKIWLQQKDIENILITSGSTDRTVAHLYNIAHGLKSNGYVVQLFTSDMDIPPLLKDVDVVQEARNVAQPPLSSVQSLVRKRMFLLQLDTIARGVTFNRETVEEMFVKDKLPAEAKGNELMCRRAVAYAQLLGNSGGEWEDLRYLFPSFLEIYQEFERSNCLIEEITRNHFKRAAFIIGDLSKIIGYGRDTNSRAINTLKKAMQDACRVGVLFVLFTRTVDDVGDLVSGLRYTIFDAPDSRAWGRVRTEAPAELKDNLAVLFDNMDSDNPQRKFKRTLLKREF